MRSPSPICGEMERANESERKGSEPVDVTSAMIRSVRGYCNTTSTGVVSIVGALGATRGYN